MGYYTRFSLEIISGDDHATDWEKEISLNTSYAGGNLFTGEYKWYSHTSDMIDFSKKHPNMVFCVSGEGEDSGDIWKEYHKNGKVQLCPGRITYDEYDPSKLA